MRSRLESQRLETDAHTAVTQVGSHAAETRLTASSSTGGDVETVLPIILEKWKLWASLSSEWLALSRFTTHPQSENIKCFMVAIIAQDEEEKNIRETMMLNAQIARMFVVWFKKAAELIGDGREDEAKNLEVDVSWNSLP